MSSDADTKGAQAAGSWLQALPRTGFGRLLMLLAVLEIVSLLLAGEHIMSAWIAIRTKSSSFPLAPMRYSTSDTLVRSWTSISDAAFTEWSSREKIEYSNEDSLPNVLVLTPMKDCAKDLPLYFALLDRLSYPKSSISLGILEGDSSDDTYDALVARFEQFAIERRYRRLTLVRKHFNSGNRDLTGHERHAFALQGRRRSVQAKARNHLQSTALHDEAIVLWLDADLRQYPSNIIERMMSAGVHMVTADCISPSGQCYDRNNWRETSDSLVAKSFMPSDALMVEGYPSQMTSFRESLCDIVVDEEDANLLIEVHGVGGTALMVRADLIREGLFFPTFVFRHAIETEGIAQVALAMGATVYAMPNLKVYHEQ